MLGTLRRPSKDAGGNQDLMLWNVGIPGKENTSWEGGLYKLEIKFGTDYPTKAPTCKFTPVIFHPNIYPSGKVCLSILNDEGWKPSITLKQIVLGIQDLLDTPNNDDPAQCEASSILRKDRTLYENKVKEQAKKFTPA